MGPVWNGGTLKALPLAGGAAGSREGPKCWSCTGDVGWVEGGDEQLIGCSCARGIHVGCSASGNSQQVLEKVTAWSVGYELDSLLLKKGFFGTLRSCWRRGLFFGMSKSSLLVWEGGRGAMCWCQEELVLSTSTWKELRMSDPRAYWRGRKVGAWKPYERVSVVLAWSSK